MIELHENDVGTVLSVTVLDAQTKLALDLSETTKKVFIFRKPSGTTVQKTASFGTDGSDGVLTYTFVAGDLTPFGSWSVNVYVETILGKWYSSVATFQVHANLAVAT